MKRKGTYHADDSVHPVRCGCRADYLPHEMPFAYDA